MMNKLHLKVNIDQLKAFDNNPKKHNDELIEKSIKELGFIDDIVIDENNRILSGHGRVKALRKLGYKEIDAIRILDLTEAQKKKYLILSNKSVESGGWENDLLKGFSKELLSEAGWGDDELKMIFSLDDIENTIVDPLKLEVITVEAPETPILKERTSFYCQTIEEYNIINSFFNREGKKLDKNKLLELIKANAEA